jgi:hypothetical protein
MRSLIYLLLMFGLANTAMPMLLGTSSARAEPQAAPAPQPTLPMPPTSDAVEPESVPADTTGTSPESGADNLSEGHAKPSGESADASAVPLFDLGQLPFPARKMHELLLAAAKSGDIENLRAYVGTGDEKTMLTFGGMDGDPIEFLKSLSGDGDGYEILAILQDVLETGFVQLEKGTENEIFVWPYFYATPLDGLTPQQRVELYRLVTHGDFEDMKSFGSYNFYRVGITPEGRWQFFVAGD